MPRLAPQLNGNPACIEHRITLGTHERNELKRISKSVRFNRNLNTAMLGIGAISIAAAAFGGVYLLSLAKDLTGDVADKGREWWDLAAGGDGSGGTFSVPARDYSGSPAEFIGGEANPNYNPNWGEPSDREIENPLAGTPGFGGLFSLGMTAGAWLPNPLAYLQSAGVDA